MALQTCFLPHFPRTLQGRAKASESSRVARGLRQLRDLALPDLAALLGGLLPADFFVKAPDAQAKRDRIYPPITLFWAFLFQVLNPAMPCRKRCQKDAKEKDARHLIDAMEEFFAISGGTKTRQPVDDQGDAMEAVLVGIHARTGPYPAAWSMCSLILVKAFAVNLLRCLCCLLLSRSITDSKHA